MEMQTEGGLIYRGPPYTIQTVHLGIFRKQNLWILSLKRTGTSLSVTDYND
jgi:hypothetical protein